MLLELKLLCPFCAGDVQWLYDTDDDQLHRSAQGCPGGCTVIYELSTREISVSDAKEFVDDLSCPQNNIDLRE